MPNRQVTVTLAPGKKFEYSQEHLVVFAGETITWKMKKKNTTTWLPFSLIMKSPVSPLEWATQKSDSDKKIVGTVAVDAEPGFYPYAVCYVDGTELLIGDPDIIVHPPGGRG